MLIIRFFSINLSRFTIHNVPYVFRFVFILTLKYTKSASEPFIVRVRIKDRC